MVPILVAIWCIWQGSYQANILWKIFNEQKLMKMQLGVVTQLRAHTEVKSLTTSYGHHSRHHGNEDDNNRKIFTFITFHGA